MIKTAFILSAGLGTRIRPLSSLYPKPLLSIYDKPVLCTHIDQLQKIGVNHIIINTHYMPYKIESLIHYYINMMNYNHLKITFLYEPQILGTGGALQKVEPMIKDHCFLMINSDIVHDFDYNRLYDSLGVQGGIAHLVIKKTQIEKLKQVAISSYPLIDSIADIHFIKTDQNQKKYLFCGIHLLTKDIFQYVLKNTFQCIIRDVYKRARDNKEKIYAVIHDGNWFDIGNLDSFKEVHQHLFI